MTKEMSQFYSNPMKRPRIDKVVINISVGKSGEPLQKAMNVIQQITGHKACQRRAKMTVRDWGIRKSEPIACMVTLRGADALMFLENALETAGNRLPRFSFDKLGNVSFGIREHIELAGVKYDPDIGIVGMDVCTTMEKRGYRVKRRRYLKNKVGKNQLVTPVESMNFLKESFGIEIID